MIEVYQGVMTESNSENGGVNAASDRLRGTTAVGNTAFEGASPVPSTRTVIADGGGVEGSETGGTYRDERYCESCGSAVTANAEICPECGVRIGGTEAAVEPAGRWKAAILGGIVSFFLGWIPFVGPAAGGALAGYLRGSATKESALTGTLANVLASIPAVLLVGLFVFLGVLGAGTMGGSAGAEAALGLVVWLFIFAFSFAYFWGLGAVGGAIGASMTDRGQPT